MSIMVCMEYPLTFSIASCDHTITFLGILFVSFCPTNLLACISLFISFILTSLPSLLFSLHFLLSFSPPLSFSFALFIIIICICFTFTPHSFHVCFYLQIGPCCHYFVLTLLLVSICKLRPITITYYL
jgi:hypothetical protein